MWRAVRNSTLATSAVCTQQHSSFSNMFHVKPNDRKPVFAPVLAMLIRLPVAGDCREGKIGKTVLFTVVCVFNCLCMSVVIALSIQSHVTAMVILCRLLHEPSTCLTLQGLQQKQVFRSEKHDRHKLKLPKVSVKEQLSRALLQSQACPLNKKRRIKKIHSYLF